MLDDDPDRDDRTQADVCDGCPGAVILCPLCYAGPGAGHQPGCLMSPALAPGEDGSCHCGRTVISPGAAGCPWCHGWTRAQLEAYLGGGR